MCIRVKKVENSCCRSYSKSSFLLLQNSIVMSVALTHGKPGVDLLSWILIYDMFTAASVSKVVLRKQTHFISITWPFWLVLSYWFLL